MRESLLQSDGGILASLGLLRRTPYCVRFFLKARTEYFRLARVEENGTQRLTETEADKQPRRTRATRPPGGEQARTGLANRQGKERAQTRLLSFLTANPTQPTAHRLHRPQSGHGEGMVAAQS